MTDDQTKQVEEITAAEAKATKGPWRPGRKVGRTLYSLDTLIGTLDHEVDATFIAMARTAIPFLLQLVQDLEVEVTRLNGLRRNLGASLMETNEYARRLEHRRDRLTEQSTDYARALVEWIRLEPGQDEPPILQKAKQHLAKVKSQ